MIRIKNNLHWRFVSESSNSKFRGINFINKRNSSLTKEGFIPFYRERDYLGKLISEKLNKSKRKSKYKISTKKKK